MTKTEVLNEATQLGQISADLAMSAPKRRITISFEGSTTTVNVPIDAPGHYDSVVTELISKCNTRKTALEALAATMPDDVVPTE